MLRLSEQQAFSLGPSGKRACTRSSAKSTRCSSKGFGDKPPPKPQAKKIKQPTQSTDRAPAASQFQPFSEDKQPPETSGRPSPDDIREVPEAINQRMLNRMLIFSLGPVLLGFISLPLLAYIQVSQKVDLPQGTAFVVSGLFFGAGLLGITYGILSASWNENEEGSGLGIEEFKSNTAPLIDRIKPKR